jgi:hypothetical protein
MNKPAILAFGTHDQRGRGGGARFAANTAHVEPDLSQLEEQQIAKGIVTQGTEEGGRFAHALEGDGGVEGIAAWEEGDLIGEDQFARVGQARQRTGQRCPLPCPRHRGRAASV